MRMRTKQIRSFILDNVEKYPKDIVIATAKEFGISRQAVLKHVGNLIDEGLIKAFGSRNKREYELCNKGYYFRYAIPGISESDIYVNDIEPLISEFPDNVVDIVQYVFTEMANNANDHSEGSTLSVVVMFTDKFILVVLVDDGIGIFKKISDSLNLNNEKQAILELDKGKFTTDPDNHSGEGIFFSSKSCDFFRILSGENEFKHVCLDGGYDGADFLKDCDFNDGTTISFAISKNSNRKLKDIFDKYADDDYGFSRTIVQVDLLRSGRENLISRSQAKRLVTRFEKFKFIELDFSGVDSIGQAFADEIFRVFQNRYPEIIIEPINTTADVDKMINRAIVKREEQMNNSGS